MAEPEHLLITAEMRGELGTLLNVQITQIDRRAVDQYLDATGDNNPLWRDDTFCIRAGYKGAVVPPGLLVTMQMEGGSPTPYMPAQKHLAGAVDGGGEWEFLKPVYVGDVITVDRHLVDMVEKQGKLGRMILNTFEATYRNHRSEVVAKSHWTTLRYSTAAEEPSKKQ